MFNVCVEYFDDMRNYYGRVLKRKNKIANRVNVNFENKKEIKLEVNIFKWHNTLMLIS